MTKLPSITGNNPPLINQSICGSSAVNQKSDQSQLFLIDFGLTSPVKDAKKYKFRGTPYFASSNALQRIQAGPKDDVESLLYILIYLYNGELPWKRDLPVLKEDLLSNVEIQNVIAERDPFNLTQGMEPEFGMMLSYL